VCHAPQAAMTDVPRFWPLLDCTILSRHSMTRSSLAPSSTSLHMTAATEAGAKAVLSVYFGPSEKGPQNDTCAGGVSKGAAALPRLVNAAGCAIICPLKTFLLLRGRAKTACARLGRMHG
jgi:hypothetical protein